MNMIWIQCPRREYEANEKKKEAESEEEIEDMRN